MVEFLIDFRYPIWVLGTLLLYWLVRSIPEWQRVARGGTWNAERDYAAWRLRQGLMALGVLLPLLLITTAASFW